MSDRSDWIAAGAIMMVILGHLALIAIMCWLLPLPLFIGVIVFELIALAMAGAGFNPISLFRSE